MNCSEVTRGCRKIGLCNRQSRQESSILWFIIALHCRRSIEVHVVSKPARHKNERDNDLLWMDRFIINTWVVFQLLIGQHKISIVSPSRIICQDKWHLFWIFPPCKLYSLRLGSLIKTAALMTMISVVDSFQFLCDCNWKKRAIIGH